MKIKLIFLIKNIIQDKMASIKTITKFLCEEYGIPFEEAILKIYNDENETCFPIVRQEKTDLSRELRYELEEAEAEAEAENTKKQERNENVQPCVDEEEVDMDEYFEKINDKEYKCYKCEKIYKNLGKCARKHIETCC